MVFSVTLYLWKNDLKHPAVSHFERSLLTPTSFVFCSDWDPVPPWVGCIPVLGGHERKIAQENSFSAYCSLPNAFKVGQDYAKSPMDSLYFLFILHIW